LRRGADVGATPEPESLVRSRRQAALAQFRFQATLKRTNVGYVPGAEINTFLDD